MEIPFACCILVWGWVLKKNWQKIRWEKYDQFMCHILPKFCPIFAPYFSHPVFQVSVIKTRILYIRYLQNRYLIIIQYLLCIASPFSFPCWKKCMGIFCAINWSYFDQFMCHVLPKIFPSFKIMILQYTMKLPSNVFLVGNFMYPIAIRICIYYNVYRYSIDIKYL